MLLPGDGSHQGGTRQAVSLALPADHEGASPDWLVRCTPASEGGARSHAQKEQGNTTQ